MILGILGVYSTVCSALHVEAEAVASVYTALAFSLSLQKFSSRVPSAPGLTRSINFRLYTHQFHVKNHLEETYAHQNEFSKWSNQQKCP